MQEPATNKQQSSELKAKVTTAKTVKEVADISYRQLNDWDSKKVLPKKKGGDGTWRKFTGADIIRLAIISKLVKFGIPIQRQKKLIQWLNKPESISWLITKITYGFNMFLVTDFEGNFGFDSDDEAYDFVFLIGEDIDHPSVILPLNKIVGDISRRLGVKIPKVNKNLTMAGQMSHILKKMTKSDNGVSIKSTEQKVIDLIREKQYQTVVVKVKDGNIVHINREESIPIKE